MKKLITILITIIAILTLSACVDGRHDKIKESANFKYINHVNLPSYNKENIALDKGSVDKYNSYAVELYEKIYEENENTLCSPASLFMALSMLGEGAKGNSLDEINNLLKVSDVRYVNDALFKNNYYKNNDGEAKIANSYWINMGLDVKDEYVKTLNDVYFAEGFKTIFNDEAISNMAKWINYNTNGLLDVKKEDLNDMKEVDLCLINTIYFDNKWKVEFDEKNTITDTFYGNTEISAKFMRHKVSTTYYETANYSAAIDHFYNGNSITYILPNEDKTIDDCIKSIYTTDKNEILKQKYLDVNFKVPKFKYIKTMDLEEILPSLGVNDIFSKDRADLSGISDTFLYVEKIRQGAGIEFNETGVKAAAYTIAGACGSSGSVMEQIDFVLNRPFIYYITDSRGLILFIGCVNNPSN